MIFHASTTGPTRGVSSISTEQGRCGCWIGAPIIPSLSSSGPWGSRASLASPLRSYVCQLWLRGGLASSRFISHCVLYTWRRSPVPGHLRPPVQSSIFRVWTLLHDGYPVCEHDQSSHPRVRFVGAAEACRLAVLRGCVRDARLSHQATRCCAPPAPPPVSLARFPHRRPACPVLATRLAPPVPIPRYQPDAVVDSRYTWPNECLPMEGRTLCLCFFPLLCGSRPTFGGFTSRELATLWPLGLLLGPVAVASLWGRSRRFLLVSLALVVWIMGSYLWHFGALPPVVHEGN